VKLVVYGRRILNQAFTLTIINAIIVLNKELYLIDDKRETHLKNNKQPQHIYPRRKTA